MVLTNAYIKLYNVSVNELQYPMWTEDFLFIMKEFKTLDEQINLLNERGVIINDITDAKKKLLTNNYYNVINGYKEPFLKDNINYRDGTTFDEIFALYDFDRALRDILLKYILKIENTLKTLIAYYFSMYHGNYNYLKIDSFETFSSINASQNKKIERLKYIQELIIDIQKKTSRAMTTKEYVKHYMITYGFVPLWVLINIFSFGEISKFFELMKQSEKNAVAKYFNCREDELMQFIKIMNFYRNLCAHDERVYNTVLPKYIYIKDNEYHKILNIPQNNGMYMQGKNDLFALIITLKILLDEDDFRTMYNKIYGRIASLEKHLNVLNIDEILSIMKFPKEWKKIKSPKSTWDI